MLQLRQPDLRLRTKTASLHAIQLFRALPEQDEILILGKRMLRMITRAGAFYRAALRCRRLHSYTKRLDSALYDLELAAYWLELLIESDSAPPRCNLQSLLTEVHELMAILVSCKKLARKAGNKQALISSN